MLELFQYKSQIRVVKTALVATGFFVVLPFKESGWSSTTAKADEVAGRFLFAFAPWFSSLVLRLVLWCHLLHPDEKLLITPHTSKNQCNTAEQHEDTKSRTHTSLRAEVFNPK